MYVGNRYNGDSAVQGDKSGLSANARKETSQNVLYSTISESKLLATSTSVALSSPGHFILWPVQSLAISTSGVFSLWPL